MPNRILISKKINPYKKKIKISSDKSLSIRCLLLASQAIGKSYISNLLESEDVINSINIINKMGIKIKKKKDVYEVDGLGLNGFEIKNKTKIYAGNSGTLARLILGLLVKSNNYINWR